MAYLKHTYNSLTYYKWDNDDEQPKDTKFINDYYVEHEKQLPSRFFILIVIWQDGYKVEDLSKLNLDNKKNNLDLLVVNFNLIGQQYNKDIDYDIELVSIYFSGSFSIEGCKFDRTLLLKSVTVFNKCEISNSYFYKLIIAYNMMLKEFILSGNELEEFSQITGNILFGELYIDYNRAKHFSFSLNYYASVIYFNYNNIGKEEINSNKFIDPSQNKLLENEQRNKIDEVMINNNVKYIYEHLYTCITEISPSIYFKNVQKIKEVDWEDFRISLCNFKDYYLRKNDYTIGQIFRNTERKAHLMIDLKKSKWCRRRWIYICYYIDKINSFIGYHFVSIIPLLALVFALLGLIFTIYRAN